MYLCQNQIKVAVDITFVYVISDIWLERILKLKCSPQSSIQSFQKRNKKCLTLLHHINIIHGPHQNPLETKPLSRNLSSKPLWSIKCIEEPLSEYKSIFFVISRAWWDKSVSKRFKGKAVSLSVSPVSHFEDLVLFVSAFFSFVDCVEGVKVGFSFCKHSVKQREAAAQKYHTSQSLY